MELFKCKNCGLEATDRRIVEIFDFQCPQCWESGVYNWEPKDKKEI